jgi:DNA-binding transcriptional regulator YiaG
MLQPTCFPDAPMANLTSVLKSEITRLARKEIKGAVDPLRKANAGYRREIAELKRQVATLQKGLKGVSRTSRAESAAVAAPRAATRFVPKGLKSLRARLGLSAADFGLLVGASGQSVYNWEAGKATPRGTQQAAIAAMRGVGKREAMRRLDALV